MYPKSFTATKNKGGRVERLTRPKKPHNKRNVAQMADKMTVEQMQAMIAALQAQNATMAAKVAAKETIHFKVSEKKAVSIMGLQRFPVTLYAGQWERIIQNIDALKAFIEAHKAVLAVKE